MAKVETAEPQKPDIVITLTHREAQVLNRILWNVSGETPEGAGMSSLSDSLDEIGINGSRTETGLDVEFEFDVIVVRPFEDNA